MNETGFSPRTTTDMREAVALITLILLLWVGWKQPYRNHLADLLGARSKRVAGESGTPNTVANAAPPEAPAPPDNSWMWQRGKLDNPNDVRASRGR
jgi:hypothetical protein